MKMKFSPRVEVSPLTLASSSWIRRVFLQNEDFPPASDECRAPVLRSLPKSMHNNAKINAQQCAVFHLYCISSGGEKRSRTRPAAMPCPSVPVDGLAWAHQEHSCPGTLVLMIIRLCWRGTANDDNNHHHSHYLI